MSTGDWTAVPPTELCYSVSDFMDGELPADDAVKFELHLARCDYCAQMLGDGWLLDERMKRQRSPGTKRAGWKLPVLVSTGAVAAVAAAIVVALVVGHDVELAPHRSSMARLPNQAHLPLADRSVLASRPSEPTLSVGNADQLRDLANYIHALDRKKNYLAAASTLVEWGMADQAAPYLDRIPDSADKDVLASAILLEKKEAEPEQALEKAERALRQRPGYAPALWNRGLALLRLKLPAAAERAFQDVAGEHEPGWSGEALEEVKEARGQFERRRRTYREASEACRRMVETGAPIPDGLALSVPGLSRACLYKAARAARSQEQAAGLLPLARRLDALDREEWLVTYVMQVASKNFAVRKPLAEKYRPLALGQLLPEQIPALLQALRGSAESDILLGALGDAAPVLRGQVREEYRNALAKVASSRSKVDPWVVMLSHEQEALHLLREGNPIEALALLNHTIADCGAHKPVRAMDFGCAVLRRQLMQSYTETSRTTEAREQGQKALELAGLANDWNLEIKILADLGFAESQGGHGALALGLLTEALQRDPDGCNSATPIVGRPIDWDFIRSSLASEHFRGLDFNAAQKDLAEAGQCPRSQWLSHLFVLADLARRQPPTPGEIAAFNEGLASTASGLTGGDQVMALHVRGRFQSAVEPTAGRQTLRQALDEAEKLAGDDEARKARTYSYTTLILAAGKDGAFEEALKLFGEELRSQLPRTCMLAVAAEDERALVVSRGPTGAIRGNYQDDRSERPETSPGLIPDAIFRADLRGCASVVVIARPPLVGKPGLIPDDVAWSYFGGTGASAGPASPGGTTLLVTSPSPPPDLGLKAIEPISLEDQDGLDVLTLQGADATPERVTEEMRRASVIYAHMHGMLTDSADPATLVLSPGANGNYQLTTSAIRGMKLAHQPIVILIACDAGHVSPYLHEASSLPTAFLTAGASLVFAATTQIPTSEGPRFFQELMKRIRSGADPAVALRDAKQTWRGKADHDWVQQVLLFQSAAEGK